MIVRRGYVARLAPTSKQAELLDAQGHATRALWNLLHEWWQMNSQNRRISPAEASAAIRLARREIDWLAIVPAQAAEAVFKTYYRSWKNCWAGRSKEPRFKARARARMAVDIPQAEDLRTRRLSARWGRVTVMKVGHVKFHWTRKMPGRVTGARLSNDSLGWHILFRTEIEMPDPTPHLGPSIGVDRGVNVALALSDGKHRTHGAWLRPKEVERFIRLNHEAARKQRSRKRGQPVSNRLYRTYRQIAAIYARAKRRRYDWQHKVTTDLARKYGLIVVEDLQLANMTRSAKGTIDKPGKGVRQKSGLNRVMLDEAHGRTIEFLAYKLAERGGTLGKVPAAYTSLRCSACGVLGERVTTQFSCPSCGFAGHADYNAALNILAAGLAVNGRQGVPTRACAPSTTRGAV